MSLQRQTERLRGVSVTPTPPPASSCAWMPLEGIAQQWATFAATFFTYSAFSATAAVFSALAWETQALQQYEHASSHRFKGEDLSARTIGEQIVHALEEAAAEWLCVLCWLDQLASDRSHLLDAQERAMLPPFVTEAITHHQRMHVLVQQVQSTTVLRSQQQGHEKGERCS